ncbi:MAG: hypothetical protein ABSE62_09005 [Chthoniobacteraceae bacterium]
MITSISPAQASPGNTVLLTGSGFTSTTGVGFAAFTGTAAASFTVVSDTEMSVIVPNLNLGPRQSPANIYVNTTSGMTVTLDSNSTVVEAGQSVSSGGSADVYVEASGTAVNNGSGSDTYFLENGATLTGGGGGGSNAAYAAPGATVSLGGVTVIPVAGMTPSFIPVQFEALPSSPVVTTGTVSNITITGATVSGTVNPQAFNVTAYFQYGTDQTYGNQTAGTTVFFSTAGVTATLTNLQPNTLYHYQLVASYRNGNATAYGADQTFTTLALSGGGPGVAMNPIAGVTCTGATLSAIVNPNGSATSTYFQYGLTGTYGTTTTVQASGSGSSDVAQSVTLTNLQPNTTYHFDAVATNSAGATSGSDQVFQTGAVGVTGFSPAQGPVGSTVTLYGVGFTNATSVTFSNDLATSVSAGFTVLSDTTMQVTVPGLGIRYGGFTSPWSRLCGLLPKSLSRGEGIDKMACSYDGRTCKTK